jgi:hypothetical protein
MPKLASNDENVQEWLEMVEADLKKHGTKLKLFHKKLRMGDSAISGYFSHEEAAIVLNTKAPFLDLLVHEYNHFRQAIEIPDLFHEWLNGSCPIWDWVDGTSEFSSRKERNYAFDCIINLERDCEVRSIRMIKEYSLPVDLAEYQRIAWIYVNYYNFARKHRTWFGDDVKLTEIREFDEYDYSFGRIKMTKEMEAVFAKYSK